MTFSESKALCRNPGADGRKGSIYIPAHGGFAVMANVRKFAGIPITTG